MVTLKALFIANTVMLLFVVLVIIQSFGGMNSSGFIAKMHENGFMKETSAAS